MIAVVMATGPSLTADAVDSIRGKCTAIVVSDAYRLAPWADALVSADAAWWKANPDAMGFAGIKLGLLHDFQGVKGVEKMTAASGTNSGLLGIMAAVQLGAKRILLLGFDLHSPGDHFFGKHQAPLKSTPPGRMEVFKKQFANYRPRGVEIINCTPGTALHCYPKDSIENCLA
jgi:hypothetical protein